MFLIRHRYCYTNSMSMKTIFYFLVGIIALIAVVRVINNPAPAIPSTTGQATTTPEQLSVSGMEKYTDTDFGFSFWYPDTWKVSTVNVSNKNLYQGGEIKDALTISNGTSTVTIEKVSSASSTLLDRTGVGACPVCSPMRYYFDAAKHAWMLEYPEGTSTSTNQKPVTQVADTTENTMGGLHMFPGSRRFHGNVIIPLSAHDFLVVTVDGGMATGFMNSQGLARTIVAADPAVGVPVSEEEQKKVIQEEKEAYTNPL